MFCSEEYMWEQKVGGLKELGGVVVSGAVVKVVMNWRVV